MSRSTSAPRAPAPSPECHCCTSTRSQAAQGAPADRPGHLPLAAICPSASRKDPTGSFLTAVEFPAELPAWTALAPQLSEGHFPGPPCPGSLNGLSTSMDIQPIGGQLTVDTLLLQGGPAWVFLGLCIQGLLDTAALSCRTNADILKASSQVGSP